MSDENEMNGQSEQLEPAADTPAQAPQSRSQAKAPAKKRKPKRNPIAKWYREMRSELKKVVWPTPRQIINNTAVALVVMAVSSVAIWALDFVGSEIFRALLSLSGN